jgi:hypothetical membrane protein
MMTKNFKIISTSWALAISSSLFLIFTGILLSYKLFHENKTVYWIIAIAFVFMAFWLQRFISRAEVIISLTKDFITIEWKGQYIFHKRPNRKIQFDEIKSYKYQEDSNFDLFRITLVDNSEINFWHFSFTKDDFKSLVHSFPEFVQQQNKKIEKLKTGTQDTKVQKIEKEKTIYENEASPFIAVVAILFILAISALLIFKSNIKSGYLGLAPLSGALFYLINYVKHRKKTK